MTDTVTGIAPENSNGTVPKELEAAIERQWHSRAKIQNVGKPTSKRYQELEIEFFIGAMVALTSLGYQVPVKWTINVMAGMAPSYTRPSDGQ